MSSEPPPDSPRPLTKGDRFALFFTRYVAYVVLALLVAVGVLFVFRFARPIEELRAKVEAFWAKPSPAPTRAPTPGPPTPPPAIAPRASVAPRLPVPRYEPRDAARSAPDAYADMMHASQRGDAATVAKYVLRAELGRKQSAEAALREMMPPVPIDALELARSKVIGDRAALIFKAQASRVLDATGRPAPITVVVRMQREDGYWKLFRQTWLINAAIAQHESEALGWAAAKPATLRPPGAAVKQLQAQGVAYDPTHFQLAVAQGKLEQVQLFLQAGMSPATRMQSGDSSLFSLALLGLTAEPVREEIVLAMIEAGSAPVEERTPTGMTPMARAASACKPRVIEALLRAGANPSPLDSFRRTPRQWAKSNCPAAEKLLAAAGAR